MSKPYSQESSRSNTPIARFESQAHTAEDLLKEQTVGLVHLSDFRKRRAEALEQSDRATTASRGGATPDAGEPATKAVPKSKKSKTLKKGGLSFGDDEDGDDDSGFSSRSHTPAGDGATTSAKTQDQAQKKRMKPNSSVAFVPKAMTKTNLLREAQLKEQYRKEYLQLQEAVKQTDFAIRFSFFNGTSSYGGVCRMKKGDQIWLFLERARKLGADLAGKGDKSKKDWARISVDDLLVVRGDLIIPHHYEFHHFMLNKTQGYRGVLFDHSAKPTAATPPELLHPPKDDVSPRLEEEDAKKYLTTASDRKQQAALAPATPDAELEGYTEDPGLTKVVDRRWFERNKHIYPASMWEEYDPSRDYTKGGRNDASGNALFFAQR